jgi:hypothetical protein
MGATAYFIGLALSIASMIVLKVVWKLIKKFTFKIMLRLDDVGGFAQQVHSKTYRSSMMHIIPDAAPPVEPEIYVLCVIVHEKNM